ncbi:MAG: hypothetical protein ABIC40_03985, partial [bacterium]
GDLKLNVEVFDWGFGETTIVSDEIAGLTLESPTLFDGQVDIPLDSAVPGTTQYSKIFPVTIGDVTPDSVDSQEVLVRILSTSPNNYAPDIPGITGFDYPENAPLAAYYVFEVGISAIGPQDNHPPEVGVISGPDFLFQDEDGEYALSYATDPEDGTNLTIVWDNDGDGIFDDDIDGNDDNLGSTLNFPTKGFVNVIARAIDSGGLYTDSEPFEVYVEGCPTEMHYEGFPKHITDGNTGYYSRLEVAFQTVGPQAGKLLLQNKPNEIKAYDITQPEPWTGVHYITLDNLFNENDLIYSFDVDDFSGRVVISIMNKDLVLDPSLFRVYDVDGNFLTELTVGNREVCAIDTDDNGDIWVATWEDWVDLNGNKEVDPGEGKTTQFQHFVYQDDAPYYIEDKADECDTTDQFSDNNEFWDIAIGYSVDRIYALRGNYNDGDPEYGELFCWDMSADGTLTFNPDIYLAQAFPGKVMGSYPAWHGGLVDGDIEIDHSAEKTEGCRLMIMAQRSPYDIGWGTYFIVMDSEMNIIDTATYSGSNPRRYHFAIKQDKYPFNRAIITSGYNNNNEFYFYPAPPGW